MAALLDSLVFGSFHAAPLILAAVTHRDRIPPRPKGNG